MWQRTEKNYNCFFVLFLFPTRATQSGWFSPDFWFILCSKHDFHFYFGLFLSQTLFSLFCFNFVWNLIFTCFLVFLCYKLRFYFFLFTFVPTLISTFLVYFCLKLVKEICWFSHDFWFILCPKIYFHFILVYFCPN